jgi:hypothetical protein
MARALIQINGVTQRFLEVPIGTPVLLSNDDEGGETTYAWTIVDQPEGTNDTLSAPTSENPQFTPTKYGSYALQLIVNIATPSQAIQTATVAVLDKRTGSRYPAATETNEASSTRGWSQSTNRMFARAMAASVDGNVQLARTPGGISPGQIVVLGGLAEIDSGTQAEFEVMQITAVDATGAVEGKLGVLIDGVVPGVTTAGALITVRMFGLVPFSVSGSPAPGDPVYLSNAGVASLTPGTVSRRIGTVVSSGGGNFRWSIDAPDVPSVTVAQLIAQLGITLGEFGTGDDGDRVMDGVASVPGTNLAGSTYTATRTTYFNNLTVNNAITFKPDGWPVFVKVLLTNNGDINCNGGTTASLGSGKLLPATLSSGTGSTNAPEVFAASSAANEGASVGGAGSNGGSATAGTIGRGGGGGGGGNNNPFDFQGSAGSPSPSVALCNPVFGDVRMKEIAKSMRQYSLSQFTLGTWGGGGGIGGAATSGGGGGSPGGPLVISAFQYAGTGTLRSNGGNGGNGSPGSGAGIAGGGGGGGGAGGLIVLIRGAAGAVPSGISFAGGAGGAGGLGGAGAGNGGAGGAGGAGALIAL